jgi:hypothetical protein
LGFQSEYELAFLSPSGQSGALSDVRRSMDATVKFVIGCWGVVIAFWIVSAFSVKRTKARQPLGQRLSYVLLTCELRSNPYSGPR